MPRLSESIGNNTETNNASHTPLLKNVINELEESNNPILKAYSRRLSGLNLSQLGEGTLKVITEHLNKIKSTSSVSEIDSYVSKIETAYTTKQQIKKTKIKSRGNRIDLGGESSLHNIINELKKSNNPILEAYSRRLLIIKTSRLDTDSNKEIILLSKEIEKALDSGNISKVGALVGQIETIASDKGNVDKDVLKAERGQEGKLKKLSEKIKSKYPFDGDFEIPKDYSDLIEQYSDAIRDLKFNLNSSWSEEKRNKYLTAINILKGHKKQLETIKQQQKDLDANVLEREYNRAVDDVMSGRLNIKLFGVDLAFSSKIEALQAIGEAKKQLYEEFKSSFRSTWETLLFLYGQPIALSKSLILGEYEDGEHSTFDTVGLATKGALDMSKIFNGEVHYFVLGVIEEGLALGFGMAGISLLATFYGLHRGAPESLFRRGLKDPISKMVASMQYEDYGKKGVNTNPVGDPTAPGYKDFFEYQQREGLMEMFREKLKANYTPGTPEYDEYKRKIDILESYKLNKTKTFYSLAYKVSRDMPLGLKGNLDFSTLLFNARRTFLDGSKLYGYNPFKKGEDGKWFRIKNRDGKFRPKLGGFHVVEIDRHQSLYSDTEKLLSEMSEDLQEGLDIFYKDKEVETKTVDGRFRVVIEGGEAKTDEYKSIIDYINSKKISDEKKQKLIKKFNDYVDELAKKAKSKTNIYKDVFLILERDFEDPNKLLKKLTSEIEKIENRLSNTEKLKNKIPFIDKLNSEYNLLKDFRELIYSGQWIGTKEEFEQAINDIKNNKTRVVANINSKLGVGAPETKFNNIITEGKRVLRETNRIKNKLFSSIGDNIENSTKKEYLKSIEDYISYKIGDNEVEVRAKTELVNYIDKIIKGEIFIESERAFKTEIAKILNGGLTENSLINKLDNAIRSDFSDIQKQKIRSLIEDIKNNPETIITEKEIDRIITDIELGNNINNIRVDHSKRVDLLRVEQEINSAKGIREKDIFPEGASESKIKEDFDKIKAIIEFDGEGNNSFRVNELEKLKQGIITRKNSYTVSQVIYVIDNIQNGHKLSKIDVNLAPEVTDKLDDLINQKIKELKKYFFSLNLDDKIKYLNENKEFYGNGFKKSVLEEFIEETISEIETSNLSNPEKVKEAENLRRAIKNELDSGRIQSSIDKIIGLSGIVRLEKSVKSFEDEFRRGSMGERRKEIVLESLDEIYSNNLVDEDLRNRIDDLKTDINNSIGVSPSTSQQSNTPQNQAPNSSPDNIDFEFLREREKRIIIKDFYNRAIIQAELNGDFDLADRLDDEKTSFRKDLNQKLANFNFRDFKADIEDKVGIAPGDSLKSLKELKDIQDRAKAKFMNALSDKIGNYTKARGDFNYRKAIKKNFSLWDTILKGITRFN